MKREDIESFQTSRILDELIVSIKLYRKLENCVECESGNVNIHGYKVRKINHSALDNVKCIIHYNARRYKCKDCNKTFFEKNSFASTGQRLSQYTVLRILRELKVPNYTFTNVAKNTGLSKTAVMDVFDQYVEFKRGSLPEYLCIDEVYYSRHAQEKYNCVLFDFRTSTVVDVIQSRRKQYLHHYFQAIPEVERLRVRYVSIDMWKPYKDICDTYFKNAIICVDPFHVSSTINTEVQNIRKRIMKRYEMDSVEYYLLKNWNNLLTKNKNDIKYKQGKWNRKLNRYINLPQILELILDINQELKLAWILKERYVHFNGLESHQDIETRFYQIMDEFHHSQIKEFRTVNTIFRNWSKEIINSFSSVDERRFTNGPLESLNARIKLIKKNGNGYKNFSRYRARIMYCLNKDSNPDLSGSNISKGKAKNR